MDKTANGMKIVWILETFGISIRQFSDVCQKSPSYTSRIIHGDYELGSEQFYRNVEANLEKILSLRTVSFMDVGNSISMEQLKAVKDTVGGDMKVA